ncbi:uncharacterized protein EHS24_009031 [Apiotrichum porosum]|uniref:Sulfatase N-terminal domain-containing protein n=1 Tax=Apiotrichum porosum TaxID=105984 RepID=A0A427XNF4_9TREE|nr:uncharacterized protein EHS24_009031 [Apiotrichum porosum]RSH80451.1 hypothetical protein EHS24_009031 [Apiotrichum porosum]
MAPKNILLLIADDLGKYVGSYGCKSVTTPSLDKLASEGSRFDLAFASTASCSGSRSTLYSGLHTHENGQYGLNIFRTHFQTFPHVETAPLLFNHAGYKTGIIGKVHVGPDVVYPWSHREESETRDVAWVADRAEAFFKTAVDEDKPFFLTVGYVDPHRDITTRGKFGNEGDYDARVTSIDIKPEDVEVPSWLTDLPETRQELVEYYKAIHRTDLGIGLLLEGLERQGLVDDTLVVFLSDNGPPFINAKTTLYDAGTCLPLIVRKPGSKAGVANPNMVSWIDILPTFLDWAGLPLDYSTSSAAGPTHQHPGSGYGGESTSLRSPPRLGHSFLAHVDRFDVLPETEWQHHVFGSHTFHELHNYWPTRVLRTRRYKYHRNIAWRLDFPFASDLYASYTFEGIRNAADPVIGSRTLKNYLFRPAEELFDLEADPDEVINLATDPAHCDLLADLRLQLEQWQQTTHDMWLVRDGCSLEMVQRYGKDGLVLPDRFDIDADKPGLAGVTLLKGIETPVLQKIA